MKIYVAHSREFDFASELYEPIRASDLNTAHEFVLPHETDTFVFSKPIIEKSDLIIAEVSFPSTGLGIELAWAHAAGRPVVCMNKKGTKPTGALKAVCETFIEYLDKHDMLDQLKKVIKENE